MDSIINNNKEYSDACLYVGGWGWDERAGGLVRNKTKNNFA